MTRGLILALALLTLLVGGCGSSNPRRPVHVARLAIYDWEPNVIGPNGKPLGPHPVDTSPAQTPLPTRPAAVRRAAIAKRKGLRVAVLEAAKAGRKSGWYVIRDRPELTTADITKPEQNFDPRTSEPIVDFQFTPRGRKAFERLTRRVAERGADTILPPGFAAINAFQHIAIVVDGRIKSLAYIDFIENPRGISGKSGVQIAGVGTIQEAQRLAASLRAAARGGG